MTGTQKALDAVKFLESLVENNEEERSAFKTIRAALEAKGLDPDMPAQELRLHMGELTAAEVRVARAAIRWANTALGKETL